VVATVCTLDDTGKKQYRDCDKNVLDERMAQSRRIPYRSLQILNTRQRGSTLWPIVRLYAEPGWWLGRVFVHEIQSFPPSLLDFGGKLHLTDTKSELLQCHEPPGQLEPPSTYDCTVLDDAVIVHCLPTTSYSTFNEYAERGCCVGHIRTRQLEGVNPRKERKGCAQESDGRDQTARQMDLSPWRNQQEELFAFLTSKVADLGQMWYLLVPASPCKTEIMRRRRAGLCCGSRTACCGARRNTIRVRTADTDVVVIIVVVFHELIATQPLADIWVAFGMGKNYRFFHMNSIGASLCESQSKALPVFRAFSGWDTNSAFNGKGKKSVWQAWQIYDDVTETFLSLASNPFQLLNLYDGHF